MNYDTKAIVKAVQDSVMGLLGMVEHAACGHTAEDMGHLKEEVYRLGNALIRRESFNLQTKCLAIASRLCNMHLNSGKQSEKA